MDLWGLSATEFFKSFWPNAFATLAGVLVGVPAALWIDHFARARARRVERTADEGRLDRALRVLGDAIRQNEPLLKSARQAFAGGGYVTGIPLNMAAWDATSHTVTSIHGDPTLVAYLAAHFEQLRLFGAHAERHAQLFIGTPATMDTAVVVRTKLGSDLTAFADRLLGDVDLLNEKLPPT